jgi:transposase
LSASTQELSRWIEVEMRPFARQLERLVNIPGVRRSTAEVIIAATGGDKIRFRTVGTRLPGRGFVPGHRESAGKQRPGTRRHGTRCSAPP